MKEKLYIKAVNRDTIERFSFVEGIKNPFIIISIASPEMDNAKIKIVDNCRGILFQKYHDVDLNTMNFTDTPYTFYTPEMAFQVINFVETFTLMNSISSIIVNCHLGVSRSTAICAVLSRYFNGTPDESYFFKNYTPNMLVYRTLFNVGRDILTKDGYIT